MFEPNFHFILRQIEEKYGEEGKKIALNLRDKQVFETISNMSSDEFITFRELVYENLKKTNNLFRIVYIHLRKMNSSNYRSFISKKPMDDYVQCYQYYCNELDHLLGNYPFDEGDIAKLFKMIYEKLDLPFQQFYDWICVVFSKKDFLISRTKRMYSEENQLFLLKKDLEKLISIDDNIILSIEQLYEIVDMFRINDIFEIPYDNRSDYFKNHFEEIKQMINRIKADRECRQQYISKVENLDENDFERANFVVRQNFKIFITSEQWKQLEKTYCDIKNLIQEGITTISDESVSCILNEMNKQMDIPIDNMKKSKLYNFYRESFIPYKLTTSLINYNSRLYSADKNRLINKIKLFMPVELVTQQEMENGLKVISEEHVKELINLNHSRHQIYYLFSILGFDSDKLLEGLRSGKFDQLYRSISNRIMEKDYFTMLTSIDSKQLDRYFEIVSMLGTVRPVREEDCMHSVLNFVKQKVKTQDKN